MERVMRKGHGEGPTRVEAARTVQSGFRGHQLRSQITIAKTGVEAALLAAEESKQQPPAAASMGLSAPPSGAPPAPSALLQNDDKRRYLDELATQRKQLQRALADLEERGQYERASQQREVRRRVKAMRAKLRGVEDEIRLIGPQKKKGQAHAECALNQPQMDTCSFLTARGPSAHTLDDAPHVLLQVR